MTRVDRTHRLFRERFVKINVLRSPGRSHPERRPGPAEARSGTGRGAGNQPSSRTDAAGVVGSASFPVPPGSRPAGVNQPASTSQGNVSCAT